MTEARVSAEELQAYLARGITFAPYGFRVTGASAGSCTVAFAFRSEFERPGGVVAGTVFMAAADVAMWLAIKTLEGVDDPSVTSQMQTEFLRPARREGFSCTARVLSSGRRQIFGVAECVTEDGRLLAYSTLVYARPKSPAT